MSKHVLVTGGAGFIGSHLVDLLLSRDFEVTVLDDLLPQVHGDSERDADGWPAYLDRRAKRVVGNPLDPAVFEASLAGVTHLVHLAASVGVGQSMTNIVDYTRNNVMTAAQMLETLSQRLGLPGEFYRTIDVSQLRGHCCSGPPRRVDVSLDFTQGDGALGRGAILVEDGVVGILPALMKKAVDRLPRIFNEAVLIAVAVFVDPS